VKISFAHAAWRPDGKRRERRDHREHNCMSCFYPPCHHTTYKDNMTAIPTAINTYRTDVDHQLPFAFDGIIRRVLLKLQCVSALHFTPIIITELSNEVKGESLGLTVQMGDNGRG